MFLWICWSCRLHSGCPSSRGQNWIDHSIFRKGDNNSIINHTSLSIPSSKTTPPPFFVTAFSAAPFFSRPRATPASTPWASAAASPFHTPAGAGTTALGMCICVNCKWVTRCDAYHFVETQHKQPHMTDHPTFTPRDGSPRIELHFRTTPINATELARMYGEHEDETQAAMEKERQQPQPQKLQREDREQPHENPLEEKSEEGGGTLQPTQRPLVGETTYSFAPTFSYEYDVVACADFVEDVGCWVRNMPDEIRAANPHFIPT
jgi:Hypothetical chloroplast protein Ycf34